MIQNKRVYASLGYSIDTETPATKKAKNEEGFCKKNPIINSKPPPLKIYERNFKTAKEVEVFFQAFAPFSNGNIEILYPPEKFSPEVWEAIVQEIQKIQPSHLELAGCDFDEEAPYEKLDCDAIKQNLKTLKILYDNTEDISPKIRGLDKFLANNPTLETLDIKANYPFKQNTEDDLAVIVRSLQDSHIKKFSINYYNISSNLIIYLAACLQKSPCLEELVLECEQEDLDIDLLLKQPLSKLGDWKSVLHNPHLKSLKIRGDNNFFGEDSISEQDIEEFFDLTTSMLEKVNLIELYSFKTIRTLLNNHYNLSQIRLKDCEFTPEDIEGHLIGIEIPERNGVPCQLIFSGDEDFFDDKEFLKFCYHMNSNSFVQFDFLKRNPLETLFTPQPHVLRIVSVPSKTTYQDLFSEAGIDNAFGSSIDSPPQPIIIDNHSFGLTTDVADPLAVAAFKKVDEIIETIAKNPLTPTLLENIHTFDSFACKDKLFRALIELTLKAKIGNTQEISNSLFDSIAELMNKEWGEFILTGNMIKDELTSYNTKTLQDTINHFQRPFIIFNLSKVSIKEGQLVVDQEYRLGQEYTNNPPFYLYITPGTTYHYHPIFWD